MSKTNIIVKGRTNNKSPEFRLIPCVDEDGTITFRIDNKYDESFWMTITIPAKEIEKIIQNDADARESHAEDVEEMHLRAEYEEGSPEWDTAH